jgi:hypothetical protein
MLVSNMSGHSCVRVLNVILDMFLKILVVFIYFESLKINIKYAYIYIYIYIVISTLCHVLLFQELLCHCVMSCLC